MFIAALMGTYQHYILKLPRIKGFLFELTFGCYLAIFILFLIAYGVWGKTKVAYRLATIPGIALLGLNLLFTQARGAWLGFLGGTFILAWLKDKKIIALLLIICLLLYFFLPQTYIDRFQSSFDTKTNGSNLTRIAIWKSALSMYRDHFISGVGLGRFRVEYHLNYKQSYPVEWRHRHAHNNLLQYMAESGTFGLIAFLWLMVAIILWLYQNHLQITDPNWRLFLLASLCCVIIFNIQGLTDVNYGGHRYEDARRFFWFFMALNIAIANIYRKDPKPNKELTLESN
jgi:O-antigen ligase